VRAMLCRCACIAVQEERYTCRNTAHALGALVDPVMSVWHVGAACTVGLGSRRLRELVIEVDTRLVAR
jgi:hypothetical protein